MEGWWNTSREENKAAAIFLYFFIFFLHFAIMIERQDWSSQVPRPTFYSQAGTLSRTGADEWKDSRTQEQERQHLSSPFKLLEYQSTQSTLSFFFFFLILR